MFFVKLFFITIKLKSKIVNEHTTNQAVFSKKTLTEADSKKGFKLTTEKASSITKNTMTKFIGFDLLKMLVIINSFCIFAQ